MKDIFYTVFKYKDKKSPDTLGLYPERVHTRAFPERRYLWSSRMLVIVATISIAINMVLGATIILLIPQRTVSPRLLHLDEDFSALAITQPSEKRVYATDILAEASIIDYIKLRYNITQNEEKDNERHAEFSRLYWLSDQNVFNEFTRLEKPYSDTLRKKGLTRTIKIEWIKVISRGLWQAQFVTYDSYPDQPTETNVWRVLIKGKFAKPKFRNDEDTMTNPYGFVISGFYLAYVGKEK